MKSDVFEASRSPRLANKRAIITGAAEGIGKCTAGRFAEEGARLALVDRDIEKLRAVAADLRGAGAEVLEFEADVTDEQRTKEVVSEVVRDLGGVDVLINNVGGFRPGQFPNIALEDWDYVIRLNLQSTFLYIREVVPDMMARKSGSIVNLSSAARMGTPWLASYVGNSSYSAAKAALDGLAKSLTLEFSKYNIRVNNVAPGPILTVNTEAIFEKMSTLEHNPIRMVPMARLGVPREIADAVVFMASDEASYISGQTLDVTGGK